mgnify:CR=1 FL=1
MTNKNLVLTRKKGTKIIIHNDEGTICNITIVDTSPAQCKLAFKADANVRIDREEVYLKEET